MYIACTSHAHRMYPGCGRGGIVEAERRAVILCFDIGGTTMKGGRARAVDDIDVLERVPTPGRDFAAFAEVIRRAMAEGPEPPAAVALAIPGITQPGSGIGVVANVPCL